MTILKKRLAVLALGLAVTALASPSYARGAGRDISASDPTTLLAPPTPQAPLENRIPAPLSALAQVPTAPTANSPTCGGYGWGPSSPCYGE
jgi:predicted small secreted protein